MFLQWVLSNLFLNLRYTFMFLQWILSNLFLNLRYTFMFPQWILCIYGLVTCIRWSADVASFYILLQTSFHRYHIHHALGLHVLGVCISSCCFQYFLIYSWIWGIHSSFSSGYFLIYSWIWGIHSCSSSEYFRIYSWIWGFFIISLLNIMRYTFMFL